jgi:hypothetical protein
MNNSRWLFAVGAGGLIALAFGACSPSNAGGPPPGPGTNGGQPGADASFAGVSAMHNLPTAGGGGGGSVPVFNTRDSGGNTVDECGAISQKPEQIIVYHDATVTDTNITYEPVALYIMMDRSSSMIGVAGDPTSWPNASAAVNDFVNDPASGGIQVGLGVFPGLVRFDCVDQQTCCVTGADCRTPVVEIAELPGNAAALTNGMNSATPTTFPLLLTPTECALRGMIDHCVEHQARTGTQCVAILVTDGQPTLCNGDVAHLVSLVQNGFDQGILTFTLGLPGSNLQFLNQLAQAGGTDCDPNGPNFACDLTTNSTGFRDTLERIRGTVVSTVTTPVVTTTVISTPLDCQWRIPPPPQDTVFDPLKVNLLFTPEGAAGEQFAYVPSLADCADAPNAWYFDDAVNPTEVFVCPNACDRIKAAPGAQIDIQLGCDRIDKPIR